MCLKKIVSIATILFVLSGCSHLGGDKNSADKAGLDDNGLKTYGYLEPVTIINGKYDCMAKLDTGADTSSLSAIDIKSFEREGKKWIRFQLDKRLTDGKEQWVERKVVRKAEIKRHGSEDQIRYVVMIDMKVGEVHQEVQFTLTDRSHYTMPILIGRNYLNGQILVDSSRSKTLGEVAK